MNNVIVIDMDNAVIIQRRRFVVKFSGWAVARMFYRKNVHAGESLLYVNKPEGRRC